MDPKMEIKGILNILGGKFVFVVASTFI